MGNIITAAVEVRGVRAILWHHFGPEALPLEPEEREGVAGNNPGEWRRTVLMTTGRQLYIDGSYVFGSIREGSKNIKKGRGSIMPAVQSTLQVLDDVVLIDRYVPDEPLPEDPTLPVYLDIRGVRNPTTKARNVRYRVAASPGWTCGFRLQWDKLIIPRDQMRDAVTLAGQLCGFGNGRNIGFGRFEVLSFNVSE